MSSFQLTITLRRSAFRHGLKGRGTAPINEEERKNEKAEYWTRIGREEMTTTNDRKGEEGILEIQGRN